MNNDITKPVYCGDCKFYYYYGGWPDLVDEYCGRNIHYINNYSTQNIPVRKQESPSELNKNNDCRYYRRKWWKFWR